MPTPANASNTYKGQISAIAGNAINVLHYGALGDGSTDDTAAFNSALAALTIGQSVVIPAGYTYKIDTQLTEPTVTYWGLKGVGGMPTLDVSGMAGGAGLIPITKRGATISDIKIAGVNSLPDVNTSIVDQTGNTYRVTTVTPHAASVNGYVTIVGTDVAAINGTYQVTAISGTTWYEFTATSGETITSAGTTSYYVQDGILVGNGTATSNMVIERVRGLQLNNTLVFDNAQDSKLILGVESFGCNTDYVFKNNQSTSIRMYSCLALESEQSVSIDVTTANLVFSGGTFAAKPYLEETASKNFRINDVTAFGLTIEGSRFELSDANNSGKYWDNLYLAGNGTSFPINNSNISNNYFSGEAENHINYGDDVRGGACINNHFLQLPNNADIKLSTSTCRGITELGNRHENSRAAIIYDVTAGTLINVNEHFKHQFDRTATTVLANYDSGVLCTNASEDAAGFEFDLPTAVSGLEFAFLEVANYYITAEARAADQFVGGNGVGKHMLLNAVGSYLYVKCIRDGYWHVMASDGTVTHEA